MIAKSNDLKKKVSAKKALLGRVLKKNKKIKVSVKKAASELIGVNQILQQNKVPVRIRKQALTQNEDVKQKVVKAADDLKQVNFELTEEVAKQIVVESELAITKTDLTKA
ncbi:MAG: hypothetical protein LC660_16335, partial [Desulfobacteraceae bacterium]|nr:hypothetical protein [Desulfobacteraceae bacterium]